MIGSAGNLRQTQEPGDCCSPITGHAAEQDEDTSRDVLADALAIFGADSGLRWGDAAARLASRFPVVELLHVPLIVGGVMVGAGAVGLGGMLVWRWHHRPQLDAARTRPPSVPKLVRAAPPPRQSGRRPHYPANPSVNYPAGCIFTSTASARPALPPSSGSNRTGP